MFGRVKPIATTDEKNELDIPRVLFYFNSGALRDIYRAVALQHEPLRADAPFCEHVHPLRYYGSVQVASYESPYLHHKKRQVELCSTCLFYAYYVGISHGKSRAVA